MRPQHASQPHGHLSARAPEAGLPWCAPDGSLMALADCDSFYASCERVARPDLMGKPVVVLSNAVAVARLAGLTDSDSGSVEWLSR